MQTTLIANVVSDAEVVYDDITASHALVAVEKPKVLNAYAR